tara:strand:- start:819 stop:1010 length:192 start_codon:yes stop_codon:yes gene_type:complete
MNELNEWEENIRITAMEIAYMVLSGRLGEDVCEHALEELDINNDEAGVLEQNLESFLNEAGVE